MVVVVLVVVSVVVILPIGGVSLVRRESLEAERGICASLGVRRTEQHRHLARDVTLTSHIGGEHWNSCMCPPTTKLTALNILYTIKQ